MNGKEIFFLILMSFIIGIFIGISLMQETKISPSYSTTMTGMAVYQKNQTSFNSIYNFLDRININEINKQNLESNIHWLRESIQQKDTFMTFGALLTIKNIANNILPENRRQGFSMLMNGILSKEFGKFIRVYNYNENTKQIELTTTKDEISLLFEGLEEQ